MILIHTLSSSSHSKLLFALIFLLFFDKCGICNLDIYNKIFIVTKKNHVKNVCQRCISNFIDDQNDIYYISDPIILLTHLLFILMLISLSILCLLNFEYYLFYGYTTLIVFFLLWVRYQPIKINKNILKLYTNNNMSNIIKYTTTPLYKKYLKVDLSNLSIVDIISYMFNNDYTKIFFNKQIELQ